MTVYQQRLATLEIGLAGVHGEMVNGGSITIYDTRLSPYFGELVEGGYVIDKAEVLDRKPGLAISSPMCRGNLAAGTREVCTVKADPVMVGALSQAEAFGGLALLLAAAPSCGAFDDVAPDVFAAWWADKGARVGQRQGNAIHWQDGTVEQIRPFDQRWQCKR